MSSEVRIASATCGTTSLSSVSSRLVLKRHHTTVLFRPTLEMRPWQYHFVNYFAIVHCYAALDLCPTNKEGQCRAELEGGFVQICASGHWQLVPKGSYICFDGEMFPMSMETSGAALSGASHHSSPQTECRNASGTKDSAVHPSPSSSMNAGITGHAFCNAISVPRHEDDYYRASYTPGGTMASVYFASKTDKFSCEIEPPADELYVAVWTRYNPSLIEQPKPKNCGEILHLKNPKTGASSDAVVLDRCQSCVGVGHQVSDLTTPDSLVNGATIDLSLKLWKKLYGEAEPSVYDVVYSGPTYGGSDSGDPDKLENPFCAL